MAKCGGISDVNPNSLEINNLARWAVDEYNKKHNTHLEFVMVQKAQTQVVAGFMYYLTLEAKDGGKKKAYEAKIWKKIMNEGNELQEFKPIDDAPSASSA